MAIAYPAHLYLSCCEYLVALISHCCC